jgi:hypothetical protein
MAISFDKQKEICVMVRALVTGLIAWRFKKIKGFSGRGVSF